MDSLILIIKNHCINEVESSAYLMKENHRLERSNGILEMSLENEFHQNVKYIKACFKAFLERNSAVNLKGSGGAICLT